MRATGRSDAASDEAVEIVDDNEIEIVFEGFLAAPRPEVIDDAVWWDSARGADAAA